VQHLHPAGHGSLNALNFAFADEEATRELEHHLTTLPIDDSANGK
jgi:hypothetical protein